MKKINLYKYLINLSLPFALIAFLFFMIGIIKTNTKKSIKLVGHWHLTKIEDGKDASLGVYPTLDFENDSIVILGKNQGGYDGWGGYHDSKNQTIRIGGECFAAELSYSIEGEQILLKNKQFYEKDEFYIGERCGHNCCNKQTEYFSYQGLAIDLPINNKASCFQHDYKSLENRFHFGRPKKGKLTRGKTKYKLVLGDRIKETVDIDLHIEKHKIKIPEHKRNRIYRVIYADKNTPMKTIIPLLEYFKKKERVYFATRMKNMNEELIICLSRIDLETYGKHEDMVLNDWLN